MVCVETSDNLTKSPLRKRYSLKDTLVSQFSLDSRNSCLVYALLKQVIKFMNAASTVLTPGEIYDFDILPTRG